MGQRLALAVDLEGNLTSVISYWGGDINENIQHRWKLAFMGQRLALTVDLEGEYYVGYQLSTDDADYDDDDDEDDDDDDGNDDHGFYSTHFHVLNNMLSANC